MGVKWSAAKTAKNGTLIIVNGAFPEGEKARSAIWDLWNAQKVEIKKDGFSVSQDKYTKTWSIAYFHNVGEDSYEKNKSGEHKWKANFNEKVANWTARQGDVKQFNSDKISNLVDKARAGKARKTEELELSNDPIKPKSKKEVELEYEADDAADLEELEAMIEKIEF